MKTKRYFYAILLCLVLLGFTGCSKNKSIDSNKENASDMSLDQSKSKVGADREEEDLLTKLKEKEIAFSKAGYFFNESIEVEVLSKENGDIFYTMDGTEPTKESTPYKKPIKLAVDDELKVVCLKAKAFFEDGTESQTMVHTYFLGESIDQRFDTLVFSVITDPYNLYDYEYGIFVEGKLRDDYIKEHPGEKINPDAPANYNMRGRESEREIFLEVIDSDGSRILSQAAGIRTYGGWSRANEQKSVRLFARKSYDTVNNKFRYIFFPEKTSADGKGNSLDSFKQLVLRNCGNDNGFGFIRDELFQTLAGKAGYLDYEAVRPAALFVNGDYRGFFWLHEVYCDEYFEDHYGKYKGKFEILEGGELFKKVDTDGENKEAVKEYTTIYNKYAYMDLTVDANFQDLCKVIDIQNYLEYYAFHIYIANEDWPHNNYKTYRYYAAEGEEYGLAPFDGKWRYLLHDLDYSFGIYGLSATDNTIAKYIGSDEEMKEVAPLFNQLMKREDCKEIFIKKTLDLINGVFSVENFNAVLNTMNDERINELNHTYGKGLLDDWVTPELLEMRLNQIRQFNFMRRNYILNNYKGFFDLSGTYSLNVDIPEDCQVKINSYVSDETFSGKYFSDYNTTISALIPKGKSFDHWIVNDKVVKDELLIITADMIKEDLVEVELVIK